MSVPSAGELAGRSENNRELLERLISNTATIIRDQRKWFGDAGIHSPVDVPSPSPGFIPPPTAVEVLRNVAWNNGALDPLRSSSPSMSRGRRPPERFIASPPPVAKTSPIRQRPASPSRMSPYPSVTSITSMTPSPAWPQPMSPASPTSPELAPPSSLRSRQVSPMRDDRGTHHAPIRHQSPQVSPRRAGPSHRALRTSQLLKGRTDKTNAGKAFVRWLGYCFHKLVSGHREKDASIARLEELLALARADCELATARIEAAEARADRAYSAEGQEDIQARLMELQNDCTLKVHAANKDAEEARVQAAAALKSLEEARLELDKYRRDSESSLRRASTGDTKLLEAQIALQEAMLMKGQLQQELAGCKAAEEQREKENRNLREELMLEKTRVERELANMKIHYTKELDLALQEQRREYELRMARLNGDLDAMRRELAQASAAKLELDSIKSSRLQETLVTLRSEYNGSCQNEALLREQLEQRFREIEGLHIELSAARAEITRLQEKLHACEMKYLQHHETDMIKRSHSASIRLEEQLRDRVAAAAAAEAQLSGNHALMLKVEGDLEIKQQRIRWLEDEVQRQVMIIEDLSKQLAAMRAEKEAMLKGSIEDRAFAAASEAQKAAAAEKAMLLAQQLEQLRAEALDGRVQLTELRSQLASTLARLEGKEDALLVLKEELARTRDQLAAAEHLLSQRSKNPDDLKAVEEKQQLIDHLEARIRALTESLDAKERELALMRAKLEELALEKARSDAEKEVLAKELKEKEAELARLRALLKDYEDKQADAAALRHEIELLKERLRFAEEKNKDQANEIARLRAELETVQKALDERTKQVAMLTEELRSQMQLSESLSKSANASMLMLLDYEAQIERSKVAAMESELRLAMLQDRDTMLFKMLRGRCQRFKQKLAKLLEKKNLQQRLLRCWTGVALHASRQAKKKLRLIEGEKASLYKAANRLSSLRAKSSKVLEMHNKKLLMSKCYWKLFANTCKQHKGGKTRMVIARTLERRNQKGVLAKHFIKWLAYTMKCKRPVVRTVKRTAGPAVVVTRSRRKFAVNRMFHTVRVPLLARYYAAWQRWRLRRVGRSRLRALIRRNENATRRRYMFSLLKYCLIRMQRNLQTKSPLYVQDKADRRVGIRYSQTRRNIASALASAALKRLALRYLNNWRSAWENIRVRRMTHRMQKIESLLIGKERLGPSGPEEPRRLSFGLPQAPQQADRHQPPDSQLLQQEEVIGRLELQRQEAASAFKLGMVSADLRASCIAGSLLSSELVNAFYNLEHQEARGRMSVELEEQYMYIFLMQTSLWEAQLGWSRASHHINVLRNDCNELRNQAAALHDHVAGLQNERDIITARTFNETKRADLAESTMHALIDEKNRLLSENAALSQQLEATGLHLSETKQLLEILRGEQRGMVSENDTLANRLLASDGKYQELQAKYKELQDRINSGEENQRLQQRLLDAKLDEVEEAKRELDSTHHRLGKLSINASKTSAEADHLRRELAARDETIAQLEVEMVELQTTLQQSQSEQTQQLLEDQEAYAQQAESEIQRLEKYNNALKADNDRLRKVVVAELAKMKTEGDFAACVHAEGLQRLHVDRAELVRRLELLSAFVHRRVPTMPVPRAPPSSPDICQEIEDGRTANLFASRQARSDLILRLDAEWRQNEEMWLTRLEKLVNDWRSLSTSEAFIAMPQSQRDNVMTSVLQSFSDVANESENQRRLNTLLADSLTEFENGLRADESQLLAEVSKRREMELSAAHLEEAQTSEIEWSRQIEEISALWAAKAVSPEFTTLSPDQQEEMSKRHTDEIESLKEAVETNKHLMYAAQREAMDALEDTIKKEGRRLGDMRRRREEIIRCHIDEMQLLSDEWGRQLHGFVNELSSRMLTGISVAELADFNVQVYRTWTQHEVQRRKVLERQEYDLLELEQLANQSHTNTESDTGCFEKLAFILNTRPKIMAFVSDSYRLVVSSKKGLQQTAELFLQLPIARVVPQSVMSPLQKMLSLVPSQPPSSKKASRGGSPYEEDRWQQLASLSTRANSLRKKAVERNRQSLERSNTPRRKDDDEDPVTKQRTVQIVEKMEGTVTTVNQLEALLRHTITQYMTDLERHQFGIEGFTSYQDERHHDLRTLVCSPEERRVLLQAARVLFSH